MQRYPATSDIGPIWPAASDKAAIVIENTETDKFAGSVGVRAQRDALDRRRSVAKRVHLLSGKDHPD